MPDLKEHVQIIHSAIMDAYNALVTQEYDLTDDSSRRIIATSDKLLQLFQQQTHKTPPGEKERTVK